MRELFYGKPFTNANLCLMYVKCKIYLITDYNPLKTSQILHFSSGIEMQKINLIQTQFNRMKFLINLKKDYNYLVKKLRKRM